MERNLVRRKRQALVCVGGEPRNFPYIQTLRTFPKERLLDKVALVRFDSVVLLGEGQDQKTMSNSNALFTTQYVLVAGAKVILVSGWNSNFNSKLHVLEAVADYLSSVLRVNVVPQRHSGCNQLLNAEAFVKTRVIVVPNLNQLKEDLSNSETFAKILSSGMDIFVNDSFSQSHKVLASTVGIASFCCASVTGFHFEDSLKKLSLESSNQPYIAINGGANLLDKATALYHFASVCDGLVFVGMMAFQIMHVLKLPVRLNFLESGAFEEASKLVQIAEHRKIRILFPKDFWCINHDQPLQLIAYPAKKISEGLSLADLGPRSRKEISFLLNSCKKIIWIGPVRFKLPSPSSYGTNELADVLVKLCESDCDVTIVGSASNKAIKSRYFVATNTTSTFHSIVSTYPERWSSFPFRWRMLGRSLVEAIADLLAYNGKVVFLQSDVEAVALKKKELFLKHGRGKLLELVLCEHANNSQGWLDENPFGIRSDWERHVLNRGAPMYGSMLRKS